MRRTLFRRDKPPSAVAVLLSLAWLGAVLALPSDPAAWERGGWPSLPLELAVACALLVLLPPLRRSASLRLVLSLALLLLLLLKVWDATARLAFGRGVDLYVDRDMAASAWDLLVGMAGPAGAAAMLVGAVLLLALATTGCAAALRVLQRLAATRRGGGAMLIASLLAIIAWGVQSRAPAIFGPARPVIADAAWMVGEQARRIGRALEAEPAFRAAERDDPLAGLTRPALLARLRDVDVIIVFIESYGRSALEDPRYAPVTRPQLEAADRALAAAGVAVASGWLTAPTQGGLSWLAHATLASGLWIDSQLAYRLLITGERQTLPWLFREAGHDTLVVAPAIVHDWPEQTFFGFDRTLFADQLGYRGRPFDWVTMPDQYTLAAFERVRAAADRRPIFAEIDLISSHAPWTPLPLGLVPWEAVGDGTIFDPWTELGDPPHILWLDRDAVRAAYARAVAYSLEASFDWAARFVDGRTLAIIVGDHQPAPMIAGEAATRDVPIHVLSGDPALVEPFERWGLQRGTVPDERGTGTAMSAFRSWFVGAFSAAGD